ncbi:hypothetical protein MUCCIDRAFT_185348 [Mucor lusitanicus CBS 277.49]|uniref:Uncharacterized protein n=1 Tax=Mucor lusitanicus CBS 277.49 TaxID=747725 RepID=A0A168IY70_MUCCL|nr:hypothetical protein MUCCIDRAFT_185348 [Mucor lusitanicus CBS 277.49]
MSRRSKSVQQQTTFTGVNNELPQLRSRESLKRQISDVPEGPSSKRTRVHSLRDYFNQSMVNHLNSMVQNAWKKSKGDKAKFTKEVNLLKAKSETPRLPSGTLKDAANLAHCEHHEMITYMNNNGEKLNKFLWKDFFDANVDNVAQRFQAGHAATSSSTPAGPSAAPFQPMAAGPSTPSMPFTSPFQSTAAGPSTATASSDDDDTSSETTISEIGSVFDEDPTKDYRTCSVTMNKILRADLPEAIKNIIFGKLNDATHRSTDYALNYYLVLHLLLLKFRDGTFALENQTPVFRDAPGFAIARLLPAGYVKSEHCNVTHSALPIPTAFFASPNLAQDFDLLFQKSHLALMQSYFFGVRGALESSLTAHPVQKALFQSLIPCNVTPQKYNAHGLSSAECQNVANKIQTNIGNMWKGNKIFKHLLNKLLHALLSIHLAPDREAQRQEAKTKRDKGKSKDKGKGKERATPLPPSAGGPSTTQSASIKPFTRNAFRNIRHGETKKINSYQAKKEQDPSNPKWDSKIQHCQSRIDRCYHLYKNSPRSIETPSAVDDDDEKVVSVEDQEEEEENEEAQAQPDVSRRRLRVLTAVCRDLLLDDGIAACTEEHIKKLLKDPQQPEVDCCLNLVTRLKPYIPKKDAQNSLARVLPFCLLANDTLGFTGYNKFQRKLLPDPQFTHQYPLSLSAQTIYYALDRGPDRLIMYSYDGSVLISATKANQNKDACYNSIFDLNAVQQVCKSYGLTFAQHMTLMPGLKTVRILGCRPKKATYNEDTKGDKQQRWTKEVLQNEIVVREAQKDDDAINADINEAEERVKVLKEELKSALKEFDYASFGQKIKDKKKTWIPGVTNNALYGEIQQLKIDRNEAFMKTQHIRQEMRSVRQSLFYMRTAKKNKSKIRELNAAKPTATTTAEDIPALRRGGHGVHIGPRRLAQDIDIDNDVVFSGTDNGFVTMTETVAFDAKRFAFHLDMFCHQGLDKEEQAALVAKHDPAFLSLPPSYKIKADDVDFRCGYRKARLKLERRKRENPHIRQLEQASRESSLKGADTAQSYLSRFSVQQSNSGALQAFYDSPARRAENRHLELHNKTQRNKICASERQFVVQHKKEESSGPAGEGSSRRKPKPKPIMMIGDSDLGVGSTIKGYRRYGGTWKQNLQGGNTHVCCTSEYMTSQTCMYCFSKLTHPTSKQLVKGKVVTKKVAGAFVCLNPDCVLQQFGRNVFARDKLSALAIGLSGVNQLLFQATFPQLSRKFSDTSTDFINKTASFRSGREARASV